MSKLPTNTYEITMTFTVTLPDGETPDMQDPGLLITGENYDPHPGVKIHDANILRSRPVIQ